MRVAMRTAGTKLDGRGAPKAIACRYPYIREKRSWNRDPDVM